MKKIPYRIDAHPSYRQPQNRYDISSIMSIGTNLKIVKFFLSFIKIINLYTVRNLPSQMLDIILPTYR